MKELSLAELRLQEHRLLHRIHQLEHLLEENRKQQRRKPRRRAVSNDPVVDFIRENPGLKGEEIRRANRISGSVLTELIKLGSIYMTETENRFRRYYAR